MGKIILTMHRSSITETTYTSMQKGWESDHKSLHVATWGQLFKKLHLLSLKQYFQIYNPENCVVAVLIFIRKNQFVITQYTYKMNVRRGRKREGGPVWYFLKISQIMKGLPNSPRHCLKFNQHKIHFYEHNKKVVSILLDFKIAMN